MTESRRGVLSELALSLLLALLFLVGCLWWVYHDLALIIGNARFTIGDIWSHARNSSLPARLSGFVLGLLLLHAVYGFFIWCLAHLTRAALPGRATSRMPWLIGMWWLLAGMLVMAANSTRFPASRFTVEASWLGGSWLGFEPARFLLVTTGVVILGLSAMALRRASPRRPVRLRNLAIAAVILSALAAFPALEVARSHASAAFGSPHVVILGLDSLRSDLSEVSGATTLTPEIDEFLQTAHVFSDAVSPLARTYPAWVSILTGRHPVSTNARFNLMPRALVDESDTLADVLRARGYRTVYATDEVRFANFDESFGFDQLITPPVGVSDFLLGTAGDLPLVNLIAGTRMSSWLFPSTYANRAAHVTYRPEHFVARLDRELDVSGPSFLAIHLTIAHWPYSWAGQQLPSAPGEYRLAYRRAVSMLDRQFEDVLRVLERKGVLENAIVVVLSDHGDALGYPSDSMLRRTGTSREIWDSLWGHGTSVMSPHQYGVVLAMRAFGNQKLPGEPGAYDVPATLEDVRPTLEELVTGRAPVNVDGMPLLGGPAQHARTADLDSRIRFTETCFNTAKLMEGNLIASDVAAEGARYFEIVPETGWLQLRPERLPEIMSRKQRAALSRDALLAAIPNWTDGAVSYLFSSRESPLPRRLSGRPDPQEDPEATRLWDALQARFPGELPQQSIVP